MAKYLTLTVPSQCHEDWNGMSTASGRKFCGSCEKTVIDFSNMPDDRIATYVREHGGNLCGRFYADQLERPIALPKKQIPWLKYFFSVTIPAVLFTTSARAQKKAAASATEQSDAQKGEFNVFSSFPVCGKVIDAESGEALAGASVTIQRTKQGVAADSSGKFTLISTEGSIIKASFIGFEDTFVKVENESDLIIAMKKSTGAKSQMLPVVVVATGNQYYLGRMRSEIVSYSIKSPITKDDAMSLFPNPVIANSRLNFSFAAFKNENLIAEVFSSQGNLLQKESLNAIEGKSALKLPRLPKGVYILRVTAPKIQKIKSAEFVIL